MIYSASDKRSSSSTKDSKSGHYKKSMRVCGDEFVVQQQVDGGLAENEISQQ